MLKRTRRPSPALAISLIALFVALGGTGYAAVTINGKNLKNKSVAGKKLKNKTVTAGKVKDNGLTGAQINESTLGKVPSAANADKALTADKATTATSATSATSATNATTATSAGVAGQVFQTFRDPEFGLPVVGVAQTPVLSLDVPAGSYFIHAKGYANNNNGTETTRRLCRVTAGGNFDESLVGMNTNATNDDATPFALAMVHTFEAPGTIVLSCQAGTQAVSVGDRKIQALQVREISNVAAAGP